MLRFRGSPALSPFRLEKLLIALRRQVPAITDAYAEFVHFVDGRLTTHDREILDRDVYKRQSPKRYPGKAG